MAAKVSLSPAIKFIGWAIAPVMLVLGTSAASAASVAPNLSLNVYAKPQRLVRLPDGRRINLDCSGHGAPTVILNPGLNGSMTVWKAVKDALSTQTRVCAWDPPGLGWSDPSREHQDAVHAAADLAAALRAARISGPYIVVGHSAGGLVSLLFTDHHRAQVRGLVLVDPALPDQFAIEDRVSKALADLDRAFARDAAGKLHACAAAGKAGKARPDDCVTYYPDMPAELVAALRRLDADPARLETKASIEESFERSGRLAVNPRRDYGDLPLIVLTATRVDDFPPAIADKEAAMTEAWGKGHDALAALSRRGSNRRVEGVGHMIQLERPQAVIDAVGDVLGQARAK